MNEMFPMMLDYPNNRSIAGGITYWIFSILIFPWAVLLFFAGMNTDEVFAVRFEIIYHVINFIVSVVIFREYLADAFLCVQINLKNFLITCGCAALAMVLVLGLYIYLAVAGVPYLEYTALVSLPVAEIDQLCNTGQLALTEPLLGTLCLSLLTPFTISCLYYAIGFAPVCSEKGWLGYLVVAAVLAVPKIVSGFTYEYATEELIIYLAQLPIHLIACWTYQKNDTIWAPICTLGAANLVGCVFLDSVRDLRNGLQKNFSYM